MADDKIDFLELPQIDPELQEIIAETERKIEEAFRMTRKVSAKAKQSD